ncbi:MAG: autotransporter outer membrane beta-barrel domain-containing protein, partial [Rickettsia endosymbiont of Glossina mortisans submortisans]|nr:autotransporter outer membrane beta-barrel domain-containing protein [Rickettsia endosymbiont of Glossina mortisans submortisans]
DLLNNGAKIIFEGAGSELNLINTGNTDKQFMLYSNLNPSDAEDEYGIVRVEATTNNLTIANNGGPYTIGQDNTHRLKEFEVKGAGNIVIDNTIFTKQFNMNNTGQVTLNQVLDLGVGGGVLFAADGKLMANNGISGSVTTATNDTGTLTIGAGNVIGTIGTNGKSLKLVNIGANPITFSSNVFAPVALTDQNSQLTLADGIVVIGSVTTKNNTRGVLSLGVGSSVTGGIGANGLSLERVEVGAGASNLGGNIYAGAVKLMADDSALTLEDNATIHGSVTTKTNEKGILIFSRNGSVTDNIGENGAALEKVIFKGVDTIEGAAYAQTFTIANANANVTVKGLMTGDVNYEADGTLASEGIIGDIDFKGANGIFSINDGRAIDGAVLSTGGVGGILNFKGNGTVSGSIGTDAENSPATINIQGDDTTNVSLANDVFVGGVNFTNSGKLQLSKSLSAKNVDFGAKGGTLEFNGNDKYIFNAVIANGQTGILNVLTKLTATDASVGTLKTINIGNANAGQSFLIAVNNANLALLTNPNSSINFSNANSQLTLTAPVDQTVTFANSLKGIAGGGGIVILDGNGHNLVVRGKNGAMLGTAGNELAELNIKGDVTITNNLDIHNINKLNIQKGAYFTDQSLTSAKVAEINIGQLIDKTSYAATYALDAVNGDFELNTGGMKFIHEDSALDLKNSSNANDHTINLTGPLDSGHDKFGIIKLTTGDKNLIIANNGNDDNTLSSGWL